MPRIKIILTEIGEGYVQYQSVAAVTPIDGEDYLLDSRLLDNEDYQADLDVINGFVGVWEDKAKSEGFRYEVDEEIDSLVVELSAMIEDEEEEQLRRDEKNGLYPDKWDDAN
jgi:hypothetical protein